MNKNSKNAGIIVIGNEILSGRTQDLNISYIGKKLEELGIILSEVTILTFSTSTSNLSPE